MTPERQGGVCGSEEARPEITAPFANWRASFSQSRAFPPQRFLTIMDTNSPAPSKPQTGGAGAERGKARLQSPSRTHHRSRSDPEICCWQKEGENLEEARGTLMFGQSKVSNQTQEVKS